MTTFSKNGNHLGPIVMSEQFVLWDPTLYSVGISEIDEQHRKLVQVMNEIYLLLKMKNRSRYNLKRMIKEIIVELDDHFKYEEQLMKESHYPEFIEHLTGHEQFRAKVQLIEKKFHDESADLLEMFGQLRAWPIEHILNEDKRLGQALLRR